MWYQKTIKKWDVIKIYFGFIDIFKTLGYRKVEKISLNYVIKLQKTKY